MLIVYTIDVEFFSVLERAEDGQHLNFAAGFGWQNQYIGQQLPLPLPQSVTGRTLQGEDCFAESLQTQKQFESADFLADHGVVSGLSVGIKDKDRGIVGVLGAYTQCTRLLYGR